MNSTTDLSGHVEHFRSRVLQDALSEGLAAYWRRRAMAFEWAKPRPGDYPGQATSRQLRERWQRLDADARACRARAAVALLGGERWEVT